MLNFDINRKMRLPDSPCLCLWNENSEIHLATILLRHSAKAQVLCVLLVVLLICWFFLRARAINLSQQCLYKCSTYIDKRIVHSPCKFSLLFPSLSMCSGTLHQACHVKEQQLITKIIHLYHKNKNIFTKKTNKHENINRSLESLSAFCKCVFV